MKSFNLFRCDFKKGFTLIELLIVVGIIAVLASVVFVALDPALRFKNARDASRWVDVTTVLSAIKLDQIDNIGNGYIYAVSNMATGTEYMISNATTTAGCNTNCSAIESGGDCVNLQGLVDEGYLGKIPVGPNGTGNSWTSEYTGYYITRNTSGSITVYSCEAENVSSISVSR